MAGMSDFTSLRSAYNSASREPIQLAYIEPPFRPRNVHPTSNGFNHDTQLPRLDLLSTHDLSGDRFEFRAIDGCHLLYGSIAAGCSSPAAVALG
jgi:hypothetical protein